MPDFAKIFGRFLHY